MRAGFTPLTATRIFIPHKKYYSKRQRKKKQRSAQQPELRCLATRCAIIVTNFA